MHAAYFRVGGVRYDIPVGLLNDIFNFIINFDARLNEIYELLTSNKIWKTRLLNVGIISQIDAKNYGFSGVLLRCTGLPWDLRKSYPYEIYDTLKFKIPVSRLGDSYSRFKLRM